MLHWTKIHPWNKILSANEGRHSIGSKVCRVNQGKYKNKIGNRINEKSTN